MRELRSLNRYLLKYKGHFLLGALFVVIANLFNVFPAPVVRVAFDLVNDNLSLLRMLTGFSAKEELYAFFGLILLWFGGIVLALALVRGFFLYMMRQTLIVMSRLIEYDMKNEIYAHYQVLSDSFYRQHNTGDLMARATEDVSRVRMYVGPAIMYTLNAVTGFILFTAIMFSINRELTFYTVFPLPILVVLIYYVNSIINRKSEAIQEQLSSLSTFVQEAFSGIRVIRSFVREDGFRKNFEVESTHYKDKSLELARVQALFFPSMLLLIGLSTSFTVLVGGFQVGRGEISAGTIPEFILYITQLTMPITALGWVTSLIQRAAASQKRINQFLYTQPEIFSGNLQLSAAGLDLSFNDVSFTYANTGIQALSRVSFAIKPGEQIAIIGRTGSGKTTLAKLLSRTMDPTTGAICLGEHDLREYRLSDLRSQVAVVPQDVFLFSESLAANIGFGLDSYTDEKIEQAAKDASVYDNIISFPEGFETTIGERGITLSGGQKQRISIARALVKSSPIIVLDDCLSAVDTETEEAILASLSSLLQTKIAFIISHRISTIRNANKILVLDEGRVVESGSHAELMKEKGLYFELYQKQLLEEELVD